MHLHLWNTLTRKDSCIRAFRLVQSANALEHHKDELQQKHGGSGEARYGNH